MCFTNFIYLSRLKLFWWGQKPSSIFKKVYFFFTVASFDQFCIIYVCVLSMIHQKTFRILISCFQSFSVVWINFELHNYYTNEIKQTVFNSYHWMINHWIRNVFVFFSFLFLIYIDVLLVSRYMFIYFASWKLTYLSFSRLEFPWVSFFGRRFNI